jgi:hypothetical protein
MSARGGMKSKSVRTRGLLCVLFCGLLCGPAFADDDATNNSACLMIESAANANGLPVGFFTRLIWRESRFNPDAVGPMTRSGARAQGIAQFMPKTAADRDLPDPFNPVQALPKAASLLRDLRDEFGNLGLAAAAYNAGPQRVHGWLAGSRTMPAETERYVFAITGRSISEWAKSKPGEDTVEPFDCNQTVAKLQEVPSSFVSILRERIAADKERAWSVILAAGFFKQKALTAYAHAMDRYSSVVGEHDPIITSTVLRSRGTSRFFQVAIGAESRTVASDLCSRIRRVGGACVVSRRGRLDAAETMGVR